MYKVINQITKYKGQQKILNTTEGPIMGAARYKEEVIEEKEQIETEI